jgi:DMSO/TMAO reductase YedYZ molybdopterin-dependent catalytic subunit
MPSSESVPALDPVEACQQAIDAGLVVHRAHPLNCETPIPELVGGVVMPNARFYVRSHFQIPDLDATTFRLTVSGCVERPLSFSLRDLHSMPSSARAMVAPCSAHQSRARNGTLGLSAQLSGPECLWRKFWIGLGL